VFFQLFCDIFSCDLEEAEMIALDLTVMEMKIKYLANLLLISIIGSISIYI
jgi:hypothetical protein